FGLGTGAFAVRPKRTGRGAKRMQDRESRAISVDFEYCSIASGAAFRRSSIQRVARQNQVCRRILPVADVEIVQVCESDAIRVDGKYVSHARSSAAVGH